MTSADLSARCCALVEELSLARAEEVVRVTPLTGGVASDIAVVDLGSRKICVKFALPKLKVAADWRAPVHRNAAEYAWLEVAAKVAPESAVALYGRSASDFGFAMEFLDGPEVYLWKAELLAGRSQTGEASAVADLLGRIHAASTNRSFDWASFDNRDDFHALRIEPYLRYTAERHPELAAPLTRMADQLYTGGRVLVHGDASPKNILFNRGAPVILDAECATIGEAYFDPAFCLNHLVLKAVHLPQLRDALLKEVAAFWRAYAPHISWEDPSVLEARLCQLLPMLMLARVDGKSPVEYLSPIGQQQVRDFAIPLITAPAGDLPEFLHRISASLNKDTS